MPSFDLRNPEDTTLSYGSDHSLHLWGQSSKIAYDETIIANGRLAKWTIFLSQYEMQFLTQKDMKGQPVADLLAEHLDPKATRLHEDLPNEIVEVLITQTFFEE